MTRSSESAAVPRDRKAEHIELALDRSMQVEIAEFARYSFEHDALPELDYDEVDLSTTFLGRELRAPLLISCMTGGTDDAAQINANLAAGAEQAGVALGVGSQRKALESAETAATFQVRSLAPSVPILANLGAVQLNYGYGVEECRQAVEMIDADALVLHLNPLQEAIQPEGDRRFGNLLEKMARVVDELEAPVIVKEIGCGISARVARRLQRIGVEWIDTAGVGGTSWARIEAARANDRELGEVFAHWGLTTPESIRQVNSVAGVHVIGSGGLRNGLDVAKALALGAELAGLAYPFLVAARESADAVTTAIDRLTVELRTAMFCVGARHLTDLTDTPLFRDGVRIER